MISFYLLWTGCYFVLLYWMAKKWPIGSPESNVIGEIPSVTLVIPVRNEMGNLEVLVSEIQRLDYVKLRILVIDDQSEDGSFSCFKEKLKQDDRVIVLKSPGAGKKSALEFGVANTQTELILCSDADCSFPKDWVKKMVEPFGDPDIQLVCGPVISEAQQTFLQRFQQIEWASVLLVTQYFFSRKKPLMCSGANLAYRKSAFAAVDGYDQNKQYLSGDDEFLLKKIVAKFGSESCKYLPYAENLVITAPQPDFSHLINQRVRWAGKWRSHRDWAHVFSAVISFLIQWIWLGSVLLFGFGEVGVVVFLIVWLGKTAAERIALGRILLGFGFRLAIFDFIKSGMIHPFYVWKVGIGALRGKFEWRGRSN